MEKQPMHSTWTNIERFVAPHIQPENVQGYERDMVDLRVPCEGFVCAWEPDPTHTKHYDLFVREREGLKINLGLSIFVQLFMQEDFPAYQPVFPVSQFMVAKISSPPDKGKLPADWKEQGLTKYLFKMVKNRCEVPRDNLHTMWLENDEIRRASASGVMDYWLVFFQRCRTSPYHAPGPAMKPQAEFPSRRRADAWTQDQAFLETHKDFIRSRIRFMMMHDKNRDSLAPAPLPAPAQPAKQEEEAKDDRAMGKAVFEALLAAFNGDVGAAARAAVKLGI